MTSFAQINEDNQVVEVIEATSLEWCQEKIGGNWIEIESDKVCGLGYFFDSDTKIFFPPNRNRENAQEILKRKKMDKIKKRRNLLLTASDKYTTPDFPHPTDEVKQAWLDYRQALRDLPANTADPENPVWPEPPK